MKSIKMKILALSTSLLLVCILVISITSIIGTYNSTMYALEESMMATIDSAASSVENQLESYRDMVRQLSVDAVLSQEIPEENGTTADGRSYREVKAEVSEYMAKIMETHGYEDVELFDTEGQTLKIDVNYFDDPIFTIPRDTGEAYISEPLVSPVTGELTMTVTAPIIRDGEFDGVILIAVNPTIFSEIVSQIAVGEGSTTSIVNSLGDTIAYNDVELVTQGYNTIEEAKSDPTLQVLADVEQDLMNGNSGFKSVSWAGVNQFAAYTPIEGSNGWGIYVMALQENFLNQMTSSIGMIVIISLIILTVATFVVIAVARNISKPINLCAERLDKVAAGDLNSPMPNIRTNDETGELAKATESIVNSVTMMINDLNYTLAELASGNFAVESQAKEYYIGDFSSLRDSLEMIAQKLSSTMHRISVISNQVNAGNGQVAQGAQSLAQGSIEQATAVSQLSSTISNMTNKVNETAKDSKAAKAANDKSQQALHYSREQIQDMVGSMDKISEKSNEISKIIKAIDDIAFQTNILALNAAVEAARAGEAGKGFAVVADEVRTLATKSAESAKNTARIIEETVIVVDEGNRIAHNTYNSINTAIESADQLSSLVESIADASEVQASGAEQINVGIDRISAVVHTNSATAEESAAASEEVSGQSQILDELLTGFVIEHK